MRHKLQWNYEFITAVAAVFIGACALVVSIVQTRVMLRQQRASVWPIVNWGISVHMDSNQNMGDFEIYAENKGIGPAVIQQVILIYKNQRFPEDSIMKITTGKMMNFQGKTMHLDQQNLTGAVLGANEQQSLIRADLGSGGDSLANQFLQAIYKKELDIIICYQNMYEEKWSVHDQNKVREVNNCP